MGQAQRKYTDDYLDTAEYANGDFISFCEANFMISDFQGKLIPFILNRPQKRFVDTIMKQWKEQGMIRVVICKARKMGFSTVITAFILWRLMTNIDLHAIAGTHHEETNKVLMGIFSRFVNNLPDSLKPTVGVKNSSDYEFSAIRSSYTVKAASNTEKVGRGDTGQMIHISEIAHIDKAENLPGSILSTVADVADTMKFLESTANGMGNYHHSLFTKAESRAPGCEYIAFFSPWFEDERYEKDVPEGFSLSDDERNMKSLYNLNDRQISWYRSMLSSMGTTDKHALAKMKQEYPSNSKEAFQFSAIDSFIETDLVLAAMNRPQYRSWGAIIAGYDPSHKGKDRDAFIYRQGSNLFGLETPVFGDDIYSRVNYLKGKLDNKVCPIDKLFIDAGGGGYEINSMLRTDGYGSRVRLVEFGSLADNQKIAHWKRDEMFIDFVGLLNNKDEPLAIDVGDMKDAFLQDLTATGYKPDDGKGRPKMESKESMRARGVRSTDLTDAAILTVAQKIVRQHVTSNSRAQNFATDNTNVFNH